MCAHPYVVSSREAGSEVDEAAENPAAGERLVRVPIDELQSGDRHTTA